MLDYGSKDSGSIPDKHPKKRKERKKEKEKEMYEEIKCQNCKYFDDIMLMEECKGCSLAFSKPKQMIKFVRK